MTVTRSSSPARKGAVSLTHDIVALPDWSDCTPSAVYTCEDDTCAEAAPHLRTHEHFVYAQ